MDYSPTDHTLRITTLTQTLTSTLHEAQTLLINLDTLTARLSRFSPSPPLSTTFLPLLDPASQRGDNENDNDRDRSSGESVAAESLANAVQAVGAEIRELYTDARDSVEDLKGLEGRSTDLRARCDLSCLEGIWGSSSSSSAAAAAAAFDQGEKACEGNTDGGEKEGGVFYGGRDGGLERDSGEGRGKGEGRAAAMGGVVLEGQEGRDVDFGEDGEERGFEEEEGDDFWALGDEDEIAYYREEVRMLGWRVDLLERASLAACEEVEEARKAEDEMSGREKDSEEWKGKRNRVKRDGSRL